MCFEVVMTLDVFLELPLSMGKLVKFNPATFETTYYHPVLEISSSFSCLKQEVTVWLDENIGKVERDWDFSFREGEYCLAFKTEEDLTLFLLRWL